MGKPKRGSYKEAKSIQQKKLSEGEITVSHGGITHKAGALCKYCEEIKDRLDDSIIGLRVSLGAKKIVKSIALDVLAKYEDAETRQAKVEKTSIYDENCMIFLFGQLCAEDQAEFLKRLMETTHLTFRNEITTWVRAYFAWFEVAD